MNFIIKNWKTVIIAILIIAYTCSCNFKAGDTVIKSKSHQIVLGAGKGPLKIQYFKLGDTICNRYNTLIVTNSFRLNYKMAYILQGYKKHVSMSKIKRIFYFNCRLIVIDNK